jgi:AP-4 complex subunit sigma-1
MYVLAPLLQIMFHLDKAHYIVDEMVVNGAVVENNKANILKPLALIDKVT